MIIYKPRSGSSPDQGLDFGLPRLQNPEKQIGRSVYGIYVTVAQMRQDNHSKHGISRKAYFVQKNSGSFESRNLRSRQKIFLGREIFSLGKSYMPQGRLSKKANRIINKKPVLSRRGKKKESPMKMRFIKPFCVSFSSRLYMSFSFQFHTYKTGNTNFNFFSFSFFWGPHPQHMEVPKLGIKSELQLLAYATAAGRPDLSHVFDLHHSSW